MIHCYKLSGYNIVLDAPSGSVHCVDSAAYDAIRIYETAGADETLGQIGNMYPDLTHEDARNLISDIRELESRGKLFSADSFSAMPGMVRAAPLKALCLNVSHMCNMTCSYCFAGKGAYKGKEKLMPLETGLRAIDFLAESSGSRRNLYVDFFGGEPLLNFSVVKQIVAYARKIEQAKGKRFLFTLTTNGLLLDGEVIEFANKEMDNVVLSLDGRRDVNDASRKTPEGDGTYSAVVPKFKEFVEKRGGKNYYIRGTYTNGNLDFFYDAAHLADLGFTELSMEPVVAAPDAPYAISSDSLPEIFGQYELLADEMLKREKEGRGFRFYHFSLDLTGGPCLYKRLAGCGVGTEYLAVTPDGELFPCHQLIGNNSFLMGDIFHGISNTGLQDEFRSCSIDTREECRACWARMYCSGGCAANAFNATGDISGVYELGCALFKKRIECAIMMNVARELEGRGQGSGVRS